MPRLTAGPRYSVSTQAKLAQGEIILKLFHLGQPVYGWMGLMAVAQVLHRWFPGNGTAASVAAGGCVVAVLDHHLRRYRAAVVARIIGPVTVLAATGWLTLAVLAGFGKPVTSAWLLGGLAVCVVWMVWLLSGDHRDFQRAFAPAAVRSGAPGAVLGKIVRSVGKIQAVVHLPSGEMTTEDLADITENMAGSLGHPPNSWSLSPDPKNAGNALLTISDPERLISDAIKWPGPSRPGASIAEPITDSVWQDGEPVQYTLLNHHLLVMGATGSGKTLSAMCGELAEGVTRPDFAAVGIDIIKRRQFMGAWEPALHKLATTDDEALMLLDGILRATGERADYLGRKHMTEWRPGCGLQFLDIVVEECPDVIMLLGMTASAKKVQRWVTALRASRSAGMRWFMSLQRSDFTQLPTLARDQLGKTCFGVLERESAEFGLSKYQYDMGCQPQVWRTRYPGMSYIDALSIPDDRRTMPRRHYYWGEDTTLAAAYAAEWPASARPLDDVTGEALFNSAPGPFASTAFPVRPGLHLVGDGNGSGNGNGGGNGHGSGNGNGSVLAGKWMTREEAVAAIRLQVGRWRDDGRKTFGVRDLVPLLGTQVNRSRGWLYQVLKVLETDETLKKHGYVRPIKWEILPPKADGGGDGEDSK